ncbi:MAG: hypothetical protein AAB515_03740 [Patescibacteria group bacterium]
MKRILATAAVLLVMGLVGCNTSPVQPTSAGTTNQSDSLAGMVTEPIVLGVVDTVGHQERPRPEATVLGATHAYGVIPWHDNIEGDDDWMAVFYLPYNPGTVYFYGRLRTGQWQPFGYPLVKLHDARWTSSGFRIMIFMGTKIPAACTSSPSSYRLQY